LIVLVILYQFLRREIILYNKIYDYFRSSPSFLRYFLYLVPVEYRLGGKNFKNTYNFLQITDKWDKDTLINYQKKELKKLLEHAVKHVKFYSDIPLNSDNPVKNLEKFPIIEKGTIRDNMEAFIADNIPRKNTYYVTTGGTTGTPFGFFLDNSVYGKEWAYVMTGWKRAGLKPGDRVVSFRGVEFKNAKKGIFWQENPIYNMLEMSPFHMNEENLPRYIEKIKKYRPKYIHGYPSAISILAEYVNRKVNDFPQIKAVLAISENVYPIQRELIQSSLKTRLFSFYGMSEKVIMAPECEIDSRYHSFPEYGLTELVDDGGNPIDEGKRGELVGTSLLNYCMPFIRYRTGDTAILGKQECKCGRNHLIIEELIGRGSKDIVIGKSGTKIPFNALFIAIHSNVFSNILRFQFHQKKPGEIIIRVVPKVNFSGLDEKRFLDAIYHRVGEDLEAEFEEVKDIELTERGKSRLFIQEIKL
jgi:phenylacetate-CoA ligase